MKAMVLAAGLGTRLRPLTGDRPKALVQLGGRSLLEITLTRLRSFGVTEVIVNAHHFAEMVESFLQANHDFGMRVEVSREEILLDTGGGLKKAGWFFGDGSASDEPFILHNVDVLSTIDLRKMLEFHKANRSLASLAVQQRKSSRYLLFNAAGELRGRRPADGEDSEPVPPADGQALAFSGIHVISPRLIPKLTEEGIFPIIAAYLRLAGQGERISAFRADGYYWRDLGRPNDLAQAEQDIAQGILTR